MLLKNYPPETLFTVLDGISEIILQKPKKELAGEK